MRGPWSEPIDLGIRGAIDPGHVVGEDGRRYLFVSGIRRIGLADDGLSTVGELEQVYDGWRYPDDWITEAYALEGPKLFRSGRVVLPGQRGRRHRRPADRAHGDRRPLALGARPVGEQPAQPHRTNAGRGRAMVVARARHDPPGPRGCLVDALARIRARLPHPRQAGPARAHRVDGRRLAGRRGRRHRVAPPSPADAAPQRASQGFDDDFAPLRLGERWTFHAPTAGRGGSTPLGRRPRAEREGNAARPTPRRSAS